MPPRVPHHAATVDGDVVMCPSYPTEAGTGVICLVGEQSIEWLPEVVALDDPRVAGSAVTMRTTGPCRRTGCAYWLDGCQLGAVVAAASTHLTEEVEPPPCPIRSRCRWNLEHGALACASCDGLTRFLPSC